MFKTSGLHGGLSTGLDKLNNLKGGLAQLDAALAGFDYHTVQYIQQFTDMPSIWWLKQVDKLIRGLKADGDWYHLDRLWLFCTEKQSHARVSLVNPSVTAFWPTNITEVNNPTWTALKGYTGNGTSMYLNTNYNPTLNGVNYTQNNATFGVYSLTNLVQSGMIDIGIDGLNSFAYLNSSNGSGAGLGFAVAINDNSQANFVNTSTLGLHSAKRTASNARSAWKNGVQIGNDTQMSFGIFNANFFVLAGSNSGSPVAPSSRQIALGYIGGGNINQTNFYQRIQTFMTSIGNNV